MILPEMEGKKFKTYVKCWLLEAVGSMPIKSSVTLIIQSLFHHSFFRTRIYWVSTWYKGIFRLWRQVNKMHKVPTFLEVNFYRDKTDNKK